MDIKCTKCRYKFDVTPNEGQMEMTVVCPRCGATQTLTLPPDIPVSAEATAQPEGALSKRSGERTLNTQPPVTPSGSIPEEHMKYVPHAEEAPATESNVQAVPAKEEKPAIEETPRQEKKAPKAVPVPPAKKNTSCGKMFALGCLVVAVLAILTIAILAFAGKSFFNSISSGDEDEQEQVDRTDRNITIQPENSNEAGTGTTEQQQQTPTQTSTPNPQSNPAPVTDTGGEGNDNTAVAEPAKPTEEQKEKANSDVATAGGSYNCRGTMAGNNIDMKLNVTSGGFVTGKLTDNTTGATLDITGDRYGDEYYLTASNSNDLIKITLKKQGRTLKGTAKKELQSMPVSVSY